MIAGRRGRPPDNDVALAVCRNIGASPAGIGSELPKKELISSYARREIGE